MTKQEQKDFDRMFKSILKHGRLVYNGKLQRALRLGEPHASTMIIPTFKVIDEVLKFVKKYKVQAQYVPVKKRKAVK